MEDIAEQLDEIGNIWLTKPKRAFLLAGNAFGIPGDKLIEILEMIRTKIPSIESVGGFMRVDDIKHLSGEQLKRLAELGAADLAIGGESGLDETLEILGKMHRAHDIVEQCARLDTAGITYTLWYMAGAAGAGKCVENAKASAKIFSQTHPKRIYVMTLTVFPNSRLQTMIENGEYELASVYESIQDIRELYAALECDAIFDCMNALNFILFVSKTPDDREETLANIDRILAKPNKKTAQRPEFWLSVVGGKRIK